MLAAAQKSHNWRLWLSLFCRKDKQDHPYSGTRSKPAVNAEVKPEAQIVGFGLCEDSLSISIYIDCLRRELPTTISPPRVRRATGRWLWITPLVL